MAVMNTICNSDIISVAQWLRSREHCQDKEATAFKKKHAETAAVEYLWNSRGLRSNQNFFEQNEESKSRDYFYVPIYVCIHL